MVVGVGVVAAVVMASGKVIALVGSVHWPVVVHAWVGAVVAAAVAAPVLPLVEKVPVFASVSAPAGEGRGIDGHMPARAASRGVVDRVRLVPGRRVDHLLAGAGQRDRPPQGSRRGQVQGAPGQGRRSRHRAGAPVMHVAAPAVPVSRADAPIPPVSSTQAPSRRARLPLRIDITYLITLPP